jgi:hypothetical protein
MPFRDARLKIDRANKHISDLDVRIRVLADSDIATVEINLDGGNEVIKHDFGDITGIAEIALVAGDAVHNLKCALDYAWVETIRKLVPSAVSKFAKFPVYPTMEDLEAALREKKIDISSPSLFRLMLDEIKPFDEGNFAIWPVHKLDIRDKHRLLIPIIYYSSINGIETENKITGEISRAGFTMATTQQPPLFIPIPPHLHVKKEGRISTNVMFEYGIPGREYRVLDSLFLHSRYILKVVETLEAFLERP